MVLNPKVIYCYILSSELVRILQVVHGFPPKQRAGTEIYTYYLSKELAKRHEVHVLYPVFKKNIKEIGLNSFKRQNLIIHEIYIPNNKIKRFWNLLFFENTYRNKNIEELFKLILKKVNPDIIHFEHLIFLSTSLIEIAKEFNIPTVLTLHDYWFICPNIQLLRHDYRVCEYPKPNECRICWAKRQAEVVSEVLESYYIPKPLTKIMLEIVLVLLNSTKKFEKRYKYMRSLFLKLDKIIAPSQFLRKTYIKYDVPKTKIIYSENGYNLDVFRGFKKKEKNTDKIIFGFVGGIAKHKGIHILIDAFMKVPEEKAELRIYGSYNPKSKYIKKVLLIAEKKDNIRFVGRFEDVRAPYSEIDVLVFPSVWYENCPLVLAEARATKTPVVASELGAIPEFVKDKETGLLFEPKNSDDLYKKIMLIIENSELIEKFKAKIQSPKSIEEQAKEVETLYESLAKGARS